MGLSQTDGPAPYSPVKNITTIIDTFRERGLGQPPFTTETFMRLGIGLALAQRAGQSLKLLDLIDSEGNPTETFQGLRLAPSDQYKDRLAEFVRAAYEPIFSFSDPSKDSPDRIRDAFRVYKPHAQQDAMVRLFVGLCEYAGLREPSEKRPASTSSSTPTRQRPPVARKPKAKVSEQRQGNVTNPPAMQGVPLPLAALMQKLPPEGGAWTEDDKQRFVAAFEALLSFSYRVVDSIEDESDDLGGDDEDA